VSDEVVCEPGAKVSIQQYGFRSSGGRSSDKMRGTFTVYEASSASTWLQSASKVISLAGLVAMFNLI